MDFYNNLSEDESIFLIPMAKRRYAQFKFRPDYRIEELLNEYQIPYEKQKTPFRRVKLIPCDRQPLKFYKVKRNNIDGKGEFYSFGFASNVIDRIFAYYNISYICSDFDTRYSEKEKETNKEMNKYKSKQVKAKLENWYICKELGLKYSTWMDIKNGSRNLAKNKLDAFLELTDPNKKHWMDQDSEKKKIDAWYRERKDLNNLFEDFKVSGKQVADELGVDGGVVSNVKTHKTDKSQAIYLMYYYFADENNRRNRTKKKPGRKAKKEVIIIDEQPLVKEEPVKEEPVKEEVKKEEVDPIMDYAKKVEEDNKDLEKVVEKQEAILCALRATDHKMETLKQENEELRRELNRYKYLIDLAMAKKE